MKWGFTCWIGRHYWEYFLGGESRICGCCGKQQVRDNGKWVDV